MRKLSLRQTHPPHRVLPSSRAGWSLLELTVVFGVISVLMTVSGMLFVAMSRCERNALRSCAAQQTIARLNEQFRRDVHVSQQADLTTDAQQQPTLTISANDRPAIRYIVQPDGLVRIGTTAAGEHREVFRIPDAEWRLDMSDGTATKLKLILLRRADAMVQVNRNALPFHEWRMEAVLGLLRPNFAVAGETP